MKKLLFLFIMAASVTMLHADYYGSGTYSGGCSSSNMQSPYSQGGSQGYMQGQPQGQYYSNQYSDNNQYPGQQNFQGQPYMQGQSQQSQGQWSSQNGSQNDQQMTSKIQDSLRSAFSDKYNNVNVSANNGTVTLTGTVRTQDDKDSVEQKVRGMDGVQNVNNQVTVQNAKNY